MLRYSAGTRYALSEQPINQVVGGYLSQPRMVLRTTSLSAVTGLVAVGLAGCTGPSRQLAVTISVSRTRSLRF
jgi:hypothetical protein